MFGHLTCKGQRPRYAPGGSGPALPGKAGLAGRQPLSPSQGVDGAGGIPAFLPLTLSTTAAVTLYVLPAAGGNPDSNTLISDSTTVICLDDYHSLDRNGRKKEGVTALDPKAQDFELMAEQVGTALEMAVGASPFCCFTKYQCKGTVQAVHLLCPGM